MYLSDYILCKCYAYYVPMIEKGGGVGYTSSAIKKMSTIFQMSDRDFLEGVAIG